jgi:hypothetical protein
MTAKTKANPNPSIEICNECGRSVKWGSGWFVNRVPDINESKYRIKMGKPFPEGDYVCIECDSKTRDDYKPAFRKPV